MYGYAAVFRQKCEYGRVFGFAVVHVWYMLVVYRVCEYEHAVVGMSDVYSRVCACECASMGSQRPEEDMECLLYHSPPYFFEAESLTGPATR